MTTGGQVAVNRAAGRQLNLSSAVLALAVLADSGLEHYRGSFNNRAMYLPLASAGLTLAGSLFGVADPRSKRHGVREAIYAGAAATGLAGLGFHAYNILKRPGGLSWLNLFYAAPVGAPAALSFAGIIGGVAERLRDQPDGSGSATLGRALAGLTATALAGTTGEAGLLHFRGAYHNPAMLAPVALPPVAAALLGAAAAAPGPCVSRLARWWLKLTAFLGLAGTGFHAYGVSRAMGGWRNWSQNLLNGPPLPAPPSFSGLALAGLAALALIEAGRDG